MNLFIKSIIITLISCYNHMHPVHVIIINMDYVQDKNEISLSYKVHKKDFQLLFAHLYQLNIDFEKEGDYNKYKPKIDEYFSKKFKLVEKENELDLLNKGIKTDEEHVWFFYRISLKEKLKSIKVLNTLLLDLYFDQKNLMIIQCSGTEKGYRFDINKREEIINFEEF